MDEMDKRNGLGPGPESTWCRVGSRTGRRRAAHVMKISKRDVSTSSGYINARDAAQT